MLRKIALWGILILWLLPGIAAAEAENAPEQSPSALPVRTVEAYGDLNRETFRPDAGEKMAEGVRVARVVRRDELPGGPWAVGEIGDYVLQNDSIRLIFKGDGRTDPLMSVSTGDLVDVAFNDTMWDMMGGLNLSVRVGENIHPVVNENVMLSDPRPPIETPFLVAYGRVAEIPGLRIVTTFRIESRDAARFEVSTLLLNSGSATVQVELLERVQWGTLPVFVGGYGMPGPTDRMQFLAQWISGIQDDFSLSEILIGPRPLDVVRLSGNMSIHRLIAEQPVAPGEGIEVRRMFLVSRGCMSDATQYLLESKGIPHGTIEGVVRQLSDQQPLPHADVQIRMFMGSGSPSDAEGSFGPYAQVRTDSEGRYRVAVPEGYYIVQMRTPGRPMVPITTIAEKVDPGQTLVRDIEQTDVNVFHFEVFDADTGEPMPAKVTFEPKTVRFPLNFGPTWQAQGNRTAYYLKPGPNMIPITGGTFNCIFSRGPEYQIVEREVSLTYERPQTIQVTLSRIMVTEGMVSVDTNLATSASPHSRVSADDLVLAAAGEGVEWIISGDLNQVTDLEEAIRRQGLEKWIRASAGVHLSYQKPNLFGEFHLFPIPANTSQAAIDALAGNATTPAEFFRNVRRTFPGALISVAQPLFRNASYLNYFNMDMRTGESPFASEFSLDFDAIQVFEGKATQINRANWQLMEDLLRQGHYKIPLSSSSPTALHYTEPGYPRMLVDVGSDDPRSVDESVLVEALKQRRYSITNGPIINHAVLTDPQTIRLIRNAPEGERAPWYMLNKGRAWISNLRFAEHDANTYWPNKMVRLPEGELVHLIGITAVPWAPTNYIGVNNRFGVMRQFRTRPQESITRFPFDDDSKVPYHWVLHHTDRETGEKTYRDSFFSIQVDGMPFRRVVTPGPHGSYEVFARTPPILLDANNDGKVDLR